MLKFAAVNHETSLPVLGIGISQNEIDRLLGGQPILFSTEGMPGVPVMEVFLMAGATDEDMARDMLEQNVHPNREVN